jgi:uncharacterized repeat protein (TIGR03803 family)
VLPGANGIWYGSASSFGDGYGVLFKVSTNDAYSAFGTFAGVDDGSYPAAGLVWGTDGYLYGTATGGGAYDNGTIFRVTTNGVFTALHDFTGGSDGFYPVAGLVQAADGSLYGTAAGGGDHDYGTVFRVTTNGLFATLYSFTGTTDGGTPLAGLLPGVDGNFYGTTAYGGAYDEGTVFKVNPSGSFTLLAWFNGFNGANPSAPLIQGSDGAIYGTTQNGGRNGDGAVFRLAAAPPQPLAFRQITRTNTLWVLTWNTVPGEKYQLQWTPALDSALWTDLGSVLTAADLTATATDTTAPGSQRFYRVKRVP